MKFIKNCRSCRHGEYGNVKCEHCTHSSTNPPSNWEPIPNQTYGDCIRAMSDEELAMFIGYNSLCDQIKYDNGAWCKKQRWCKSCLVEWLKQPAKEEE